MRVRVITVVMAAACIAAGCTSTYNQPLDRSVDQGRSMVAVHLDMSKAENPWMSALYLECDSPGVKFEGAEMKRYEKTGLYYLDNVPPGSCWLIYGWAAPGHYFRFARGNLTATKIGSGEFRYMGSFQYKSKTEDTFLLERVSQPSEKEVLTKLALRAEGTPWKGMIQKRLDQL